jgi:hypothetical protein
MLVELRRMRRIGRDLQGSLIMQQSKIATRVLPSLPGRIFGKILDAARIICPSQLRKSCNQVAAGPGAVESAIGTMRLRASL